MRDGIGRRAKMVFHRRSREFRSLSRALSLFVGTQAFLQKVAAFFLLLVSVFAFFFFLPVAVVLPLLVGHIPTFRGDDAHVFVPHLVVIFV